MTTSFCEQIKWIEKTAYSTTYSMTVLFISFLLI